MQTLLTTTKPELNRSSDHCAVSWSQMLSSSIPSQGANVSFVCIIIIVIKKQGANVSFYYCYSYYYYY